MSDHNYTHHHHSSTSSWCHQNWHRLLFTFVFTLVTLTTTLSLTFVLYKDAIKEKALAQKRKGWTRKWQTVAPYIKRLPLGLFLGFIRDLLVLAIERQPELQ